MGAVPDVPDARSGHERSGSERQRLRFLEAVVDAMSDAVFSIDGKGRVTSWNRSAGRILGWSEHEVVGQPLASLFVPDAQPAIEWFLGDVTSGDSVERFETEVERRGGVPTPIALTLHPLVGDDGEVAGAAGIARDLTEQRLAQAALAETEARRCEAEAFAHLGRWLWDLRSGTVQWSDELHRIHGIEPPEFDGDLAAHLATVAVEDQERVVDALRRASQSGELFEEEYAIARPDGEVRRVYSNAEPMIGPAGDIVGLRGTIRDISP